jgi:hypothetical protein
MTDDLDALRYPVGQPDLDSDLSLQAREGHIRSIETLPDRLRAAVDGLMEDQLDTPYRPGGWTVRQVVHHVPDSHVNAYVRFKLALTESNPTIRVYDEKAWAREEDAVSAPVEMSLTLLEALHRRWVAWLRTLDDGAWIRRLEHPEAGPMNVNELLCIYGWHSEHHLAHILRLREREGW